MTHPRLQVARTSDAATGDYARRRFTPADRTGSCRRRAVWRQKLVEAERGLTQCFRSGSSLYFYVFLHCLLLATCGVLGLTATHWALVGIGLTAMLSAELFSQGLQVVASELSPGVQKQVRSMNSAAKLLVILGSSATIGIILYLRFHELLGA